MERWRDGGREGKGRKQGRQGDECAKQRNERKMLLGVR